MYGANTYAVTNTSYIKIGDSTYSLSQLKNQFKTIKVVIEHNPAYKGERKVYHAFDMNDILSKLLNVDLKKIDQGDLLVAKTIDDYDSKTPLINFTSKGHAYLAFRELPETIADGNKTEDGQWSYIMKDGKQINPGPFYIVWDNTKTYPLGWPYQVKSIKILTKN